MYGDAVGWEKARMRRIRIESVAVIGAGFAALLPMLAAGCSYPGDTSGYRPQASRTRDEINKQITEVKSNPHIPPNVKATALKKLQDDLAKAQ